MLDGALILWFILTALSLIYVIYDQLTWTPSLRVMTIGWALMILYTGPVGLFIYLVSCRQPQPGTHDQFIKAHWKQTIGSTIHCVAGDATAIIIMVAILSYVNLANGLELILEYIVAYLFGLLIFQALFMRSMYSSYKEAVTNTIFAETVSMNMVMLGMFATMLLLASVWPESTNPASLHFWGRMSIATMVGFATAYPINSWMVKNKIKHGMMSKPEPKQESTHTGHNMEQSEHQHEEKKLSKSQQIYWVAGTTITFLFTMWLVSLVVPITF